MENSKVYTYNGPGGPYQVQLQFAKYSNDRIAILLVEEGTGEDIATATVNVPEANVPEGYVGIKDYSENEGMLQFLVDNGIVEPPARYIPSGWVSIPVCKLLVNQDNK